MARYEKEGWTIPALTNEIRPSFNAIMLGESWIKPFKNIIEVKDWVINELPNHKAAARKIAGNLWHNYCNY